MPSFLSSIKKPNKKKVNTSPTKSEIESAKELDIDLGNKWNAYSKEVRLHIYVSDMKEMVRFYNQILEFPVVRYWRYSDGDGTQLDVGGNLIELFTKGKRNYAHKNYYGNVSVSIKVKDVHKLYEKFRKKNIELGVIVDNPWGDTSFPVIDPEGNRVVFFSPNVSKEKYYKVKKS
jgi:catechol 2,3-dioxygenase-like lactoylglutathione lyase family enzyme